MRITGFNLAVNRNDIIPDITNTSSTAVHNLHIV